MGSPGSSRLFWGIWLVIALLLSPAMGRSGPVANPARTFSPSNLPRPITFAARTDISRIVTETAIYPNPRSGALASGDLDENGTLDLVVVSAVPNADSIYTITIFFGDGAGSFDNAVELRTGSDPRGLAVVDLNGDAHLDIITAHGAPDNRLSVWLGNGDGTFHGLDPNTPLESSIEASPSAMVVGDFNGDGFPDVVTTIAGPGTVRIQLGDGKGSFGSPREFDTRLDPRQVPLDLVACDFDHNGALDVVVLMAAEVSGGLSLLVGDGLGGFGFPLVIPVSGRLQSLAAADLNGDGRLDLAVGVTEDRGRGDEGRIELFLGLDNPDPPYFTPLPALPTPLSPKAIAPVYLNDDPYMDLVVALDRSQSVGLYYGDGAGGFYPGMLLPSGGTPHSLIAGFFNADPFLDIAVANTTFPSTDRGTVSIFSGTPSFGLFLPPSPDVEEGFRPEGQRSLPRAIVSGDFDSDGFPDLAVANYDRNTVSILKGDGLGNFQTQQSLPVHCPFGQPCDPGPRALAVGDFNQDGWLDLVVLNRYGDFINFFAGTENGQFLEDQQGVTSLSDDGGTRRPSAVAVGDFNGDGHLDLAIVNESSPDLILLDGQGDGTFTVRREDSLGLDSEATAILAQDLDGDAIADLAIISAPGGNAGRLWILKGVGDGTFCRAGRQDGRLCCAPPTGNCQDLNPIVLQNSEGQSQYGASGLAVAYFPEDASVYLAVANADSRSLSILSATDTGFALVQTTALPGNPAAVLAADLDQSGAPAFIVVNETANNISIFTRSGDWFIPQAVDWGVGRGPKSIAVGDFNQDNRLDLATANYGNDTATILLNQTVKP